MDLRVDGRAVTVTDGDGSLLDVLRDQLGIRSVKDGCSPQGQCGCCTVWVEGSPRVACVTPVRRVAGREVTTLDGLPEAQRDRWSAALFGTGGSQCGFCTPGIIMRLAALEAKAPVTGDKVDQALLAHLCRCTGWQTIEEAARRVVGEESRTGRVADDADGRDVARASRRAELEGDCPQRVGPDVVLGRAGFADDTTPDDALVAVPDDRSGYSIGASVREARALAGKVQGRATSLAPRPPVALPPGDWAVTLQTNWVEPAYLEPDASWCAPGGTAASPCANGGAFGGKVTSTVGAEAVALADAHGAPVRVLWSREDVVRLGPKRPPVAGGIRTDGSGVLRVGLSPGGEVGTEMAGGDTRWDGDIRWDEMRAAVDAVAPGLVLEAVPVRGPRTSFDLRAAVWAEAAALAATTRQGGVPGDGTGGPVEVVGPSGGRAIAAVASDGTVSVTVDAGRALDDVVLRSYCIGASHQALSWVRSEAIAVDEDGSVHDLTVRSFGILPARSMPRVEVTILPGQGEPVNGSDAVFAAVGAAAWSADRLVGVWPTRPGSHRF